MKRITIESLPQFFWKSTCALQKVEKEKADCAVRVISYPDSPSNELRHTKLERRRLLNADFGFDGTNFLIDNFDDSDPGDNNIVVGQDATNYIFTLADGEWVGSDIGTDVVGSGSDTLLVDKSIAGLVKFILESDTAAQFDIQFENFDFGGEFSISLDGGRFLRNGFPNRWHGNHQYWPVRCFRRTQHRTE